MVAGLAALVLEVPAAEARDKWGQEIERLEAGLAAKDWKRTAERAARLRERVVERVEEAKELVGVAARTLAVQAIAEANLGRDDEALWHWHAAQSFLAGLERQDLAAYDRARMVLAARTPQDGRPEVAAAPAGGRGSKYRQVKIRKAVQPTYPKSLRKAGFAGACRLRIVVGTDGRASRPEVLDAGFVPTMAFPALEALRQWSFTPAAAEGEPVPVLYELEIRYR